MWWWWVVAEGRIWEKGGERERERAKGQIDPTNEDENNMRCTIL